MYSTIFLLLFISFYLQYNLSRKVKKRKPAYLTYLKQRVLLSRAGSIIAAALALILLITRLGTGSGIFGFGAVLMCAGCLVVTLAPFRYFRLGHLIALYLGFMIVEIFIF